MKDKKAFMEFMNLEGEIHKKELSELIIETYWKILAPFTDEECKKVFLEIVKYSKFFPKPYDLLIRLEGKQGDRAIQAWLATRKAIKEKGYYDSVKFDDPVIHSVIQAMGGWMQLSEELPASFEDSQWYEKEFIRLYNLFSRKWDHPKYLMGCFEIESNEEVEPARKVIKITTGYMKPKIEDAREPKQLSSQKKETLNE